ncbi:MAG TPA: hypothetical protein ENI23_04155 [bacterium]|nr:hypothetical protein [bacterium]
MSERKITKHEAGPADENLEHRYCQLCQQPWPCSNADFFQKLQATGLVKSIRPTGTMRGQ